MSVFSIDHEDELIPFELPAFPDRTFYSNAGKSDRTGVETAISWRSDRGLGVDASYTWSNFEFDEFIDDNANDFSGNQLPGFPKQFRYLGFNYDQENGFSSVFGIIYSGEQYANHSNREKVSRYTTGNFRLYFELK